MISDLQVLNDKECLFDTLLRQDEEGIDRALTLLYDRHRLTICVYIYIYAYSTQSYST